MSAKQTRDMHQSIQLALQHHQSGELQQAEQIYHEILKADPENVDANHFLGVIAHQFGHNDQAIQLIQRAIRANPDVAEPHNSLGEALRSADRLDEAVTSYGKAISVKTDFAEVHFNLATALKKLDRLDEAVTSFKMALSIKPDYAKAHNNLGVTLKDLDRLDDAIAHYKKAIGIQPNYAEAHFNLAIALHDLGQLDGAVISFNQAIAAKQNYSEAYNNLGNTLRELGQPEDAVTNYRMALCLQPDYAQAHYNLGIALRELGQLHEAVVSYQKALAIDPLSAVAHNNLGITLLDLSLLDKAVGCFRKALDIKPDYAEAHSNLLFSFNYHPDLSPEDIFAEHKRWNDRYAEPLKNTWIPHQNRLPVDRRLKVGYVSPDFRAHSARFFIEPLLAAHDHVEIEIFCYAEVIREDSFTERFRKLSDHWLNTVGMSDTDLANRIRKDSIDVLVDLAGHTADNRLLVFARKPAPVQLTWLGYGYTTGMDAMDYFLSDAHMVPHGSDHLFSETVYRMSRLSYAYLPPDDMPPVGTLPAQFGGNVTFGCFSRLLRINDNVLTAWSAILAEVEGSRLVLDAKPLMDTETRKRFMDQLYTHGIASEQTDLVYSTPQRALWNAYNGIDIALDPFPHNAGVTTFEALWMGVPVVSLKGRPPLGRFGSTILTTAGLQDWLAEDTDTYIQIAVERSKDLEGLATLRANLRQVIANSPICDSKGFAGAMEQAYREMLRQCT